MLFFDQVEQQKKSAAVTGLLQLAAKKAYGQADHQIDSSFYQFDKGSNQEKAFHELVAADTNYHLELKRTLVKGFIPATVSLMSDGDKAYWHSLISELYQLALLAYNYHVIANRNHLLAKELKELDQLKRYLELLNASEPNSYEIASQTSLSSISFNSKVIEDDISEIGIACKTGPSVVLRGFLNDLNWHRLYWVWSGSGGGLLSSILDNEHVKALLDCEKQCDRLESGSTILGQVSYSLYFLRLFIHSVLALKHIIGHRWNRWMSDEERKIPLHMRFAKEKEKRKFIMLNDIVWGGVNLATVKWLTQSASKMLGAVGGVLLIGLMSWDIFLSWKNRREKKQQFDAAMTEMDQQLSVCEKKLAKRKHKMASLFQALGVMETSLKTEETIREMVAYINGQGKKPEGIKDPGEKDQSRWKRLQRMIDDNTDYQSLKRQQRMLTEEKKILARNYKYERKQQSAALYTALAFVPVVFLIVAPLLGPIMPFMALAHATLNILVLTGSASAMGLTLLNSGMVYKLEIDKSREIQREITEKDQAICDEIATLQKKAKSGLSESETSRLKELSILHKKQVSDYQYYDKHVKHQKIKAAFGSIAQVVFPAIIFGALFLPPPIAAAVIISTLLVAAISYCIIKSMAPKPTDNEELGLTKDENKMVESLEVPSIDTQKAESKGKKNSWCFFSSSKPKTPQIPDAIASVDSLKVA